MKKNRNQSEENRTEGKAISIKLGLASFMAQLKLKKNRLNKNITNQTEEVVTYPKDTFLTAYDPLESL